MTARPLRAAVERRISSEVHEPSGPPARDHRERDVPGAAGRRNHGCGNAPADSHPGQPLRSRPGPRGRAHGGDRRSAHRGRRRRLRPDGRRHREVPGRHEPGRLHAGRRLHRLRRRVVRPQRRPAGALARPRRRDVGAGQAAAGHRLVRQGHQFTGDARGRPLHGQGRLARRSAQPRAQRGRDRLLHEHREGSLPAGHVARARGERRHPHPRQSHPDRAQRGQGEFPRRWRTARARRQLRGRGRRRDGHDRVEGVRGQGGLHSRGSRGQQHHAHGHAGGQPARLQQSAHALGIRGAGPHHAEGFHHREPPCGRAPGDRRAAPGRPSQDGEAGPAPRTAFPVLACCSLPRARTPSFANWCWWSRPTWSSPKPSSRAGCPAGRPRAPGDEHDVLSAHGRHRSRRRTRTRPASARRSRRSRACRWRESARTCAPGSRSRTRSIRRC